MKKSDIIVIDVKSKGQVASKCRKVFSTVFVFKNGAFTDGGVFTDLRLCKKRCWNSGRIFGCKKVYIYRTILIEKPRGRGRK